ncbi:hypothetical protein Bphy_6974 (plasmid) [Paraburkholderia phymatum STM815]|uniref:Uncharacterized protein n=1 Tax=Paraburkholderia phymatum (strain DSM 17167 / CIP 108236 / LMG 21445 / STM815) TaxID=391038 RepID=B2JTS7_PARP8|nr:hypothetical protein Bphy_6974 [Paraburkholderia phymatum STM815]
MWVRMFSQQTRFRMARLAAFKVHDRNVHTVQYGVAGVSLFPVSRLWHLVIAKTHIDSVHDARTLCKAITSRRKRNVRSLY